MSASFVGLEQRPAAASSNVFPLSRTGEISHCLFAASLSTGMAQSLLLAGACHEQDRAVRQLRQRLERARDLEHRGDADRVIQCAVVDGVAVDRRADAEGIEVRGVDDDLVRVVPRRDHAVLLRRRDDTRPCGPSRG